MIKVVTLFLVAMGVLAMFGRLRWLPGSRRQARKCPACGKYRIGTTPCTCGNKGN